MKLLPSLPGLLVALCLAVPATGFSHDHRSHWHGHFYSPRFHGLWLPPVPLFFGASPFYGYGGPSVSVNVEDEPAPAPAYRGAHVESQGDELSSDVQQALQRNGYYRGEVDGDIGAGTRAAIRQYQYDHQLEVTGRIDRALLRSLGLD